MKDIINTPNKYTYDLWNDILIPKLISAGWTDLGTQTVSVDLYGTVYNETFRGVKNSLGQVFCLENGAYGLYTIIPSIKNLPGNFVPDLTQLNWRVVGSKTPKANDCCSRNPFFDNNFVFYYNDKSFILIDISNIKQNWQNAYFCETKYNPILMFLSIDSNSFLISNFPLILPFVYHRTDIITVRNGLYFYNEDANKNTLTQVLNINSNLIKTGFHLILPFNPDSGYFNVAYPKIFTNNELISQDYVLFFTGAYDISHNTQIGNFDIFYLYKEYPNYVYTANYYIAINRQKFI